MSCHVVRVRFSVELEKDSIRELALIAFNAPRDCLFLLTSSTCESNRCRKIGHKKVAESKSLFESLSSVRRKCRHFKELTR